MLNLVLGLLALTPSASGQVPVSDLPEAGPVSSPVATDVSEERMGGALGYGLGVGAPAGFVAKYWMGDWASLQGSLGGDLGAVGDLAATMDYVIHFRPFSADGDDYSVPLHVGAGFNLGAQFPGDEDGARTLMGPRLVLGMSVLVRDLPMDLFVETAPTFYIFEDLSWSVDGQIGLRYYP